MKVTKFEHDEYGRVCSRCLVKKPWSAFYRRTNKDSLLRGHTAMCGQCVIDRKRQLEELRGSIVIKVKKNKHAPPPVEVCPYDFYRKLAR